MKLSSSCTAVLASNHWIKQLRMAAAMSRAFFKWNHGIPVRAQQGEHMPYADARNLCDLILHIEKCNVYYATRLWIKPQQLQHKVEWNEGAQHETCLQIPWDNRQQACVRWSMTMPSTVIQTKDWSCHVWITFVACPQRDAFCSVTQKAFLSTCQARTSGSTTQFFFRAPTRQRGFDHTDGMVSLVQARLEKVVRSFHYMISKKYNKWRQLGTVVSKKPLNIRLMGTACWSSLKMEYLHNHRGRTFELLPIKSTEHAPWIYLDCQKKNQLSTFGLMSMARLDWLYHPRLAKRLWNQHSGTFPKQAIGTSVPPAAKR